MILNRDNIDKNDESNIESDLCNVTKGLIYIIAIFIFLLQAYYFAIKLPYGVPPDERAHLSYIIHLKENSSIFPKYDSSFIYNGAGNPSEKLNYLVHPPFYYSLFKPFISTKPADIVKEVKLIRFINIAIATFGVCLFLLIGYRECLPIPFHLYYSVAVISLPMLPYLSGSITNDNLIYFAGGLGIYGAILFSSTVSFLGYTFMGLGLAIALLTKATAGLHLLIFIGLVFIQRVWIDKSLISLKNLGFLMFLSTLVFPIFYYMLTFLKYHTFLPASGTIGYTPPDTFTPHSVQRYFLHFLSFLNYSWTGIVSHQNVIKRSMIGQLPFMAPPILALVGMLLKNRKIYKQLSVHWLGVFATILFGIVHFIKVYSGHLSSGYLGGIQARYYFALIPCLFIMSYRPILELKGNFAICITNALLIAGFIYSGFFFYLLVRT